MGADQSNASSRWSGSSSDSGSSMSPPQMIRRMSQGPAASAFPSLKLGETLASQNPASTSQPSDSEPPSPTSMSGDLGSSDFAKLRAAKLGASSQKMSMPTSDIPQPTATIDEFTPGDQRTRLPHQPHVTHLTHPWHKQAVDNSRSPPLTKNVSSFSKQVLGMADDNTISKASSTSSGQQPFMSSTLASGATSSTLPSTSTRLQQRRMSTGSMMPPKEGPFDASPDDLHREWRLASRAHSYSGSSRGGGGAGDDAAPAAPARRSRAASLSAEGLPDARRAAAAMRSPSPSSESVFAAADKFAGGFPW